jgi:hypothetical protein
MGVFADTHATIKQLAAEGGMNERAAEILVTAINNGLGESVATKSDIALVRADLTAMESRMTNKLYGVGLAMVGLLATLNHFWK